MTNISPIVAKQRALYPDQHPLAATINAARLARRVGVVPRRGGLGFLGANTGANTSVWSGPPTGAGAGKGAATGAAQGAALGTTIMPGIGTAIGAVVGAIGGAIAGSFGKVDPESKNFAQAMAMGQQNPASVLNIANKYLVLAGLFDLHPNQIKGNIPIYRRYGRMGEQKFVTDMMTLISQAAQQGTITASDTPQTIMVKVVQPWIDSWGFGPMQDTNAQMINYILMGMIAEYTAGLQNRWRAVGGDFPFGNLPAFSLPQPVAATPTPVSTAAVPVPGQVNIAPAPTPTMQPLPVLPTAPGQPPQPSTVLTTDGSSVTRSSNAALRNSKGQIFWFGNPYGTTGDSAIIVTDITRGWNAVLTASPGAVMGLLNSGTLYMQNSLGGWSTWDGGQFTPSAAPVAPVAATTVPIPAGYNLAGQANNLQAYQGADGNFYSWNGTNMTPLSGTLTTMSGQTAQITNGQIQTAQSALAASSLSTAGQQLYNSQTAPSNPTYPTAAPSGGGSSYPTAPPVAPVSVGPVAAGVTGSGLPSWLTWGAIGGVLLLMFATARPVRAKASP